MSWEKVTEIVAPIAEHYKSLADGLSEAQSKQSELDKKYTGLLNLIKNEATVERLQLRDKMQTEMNHNLEMIEYHKEAINLYKKQVEESNIIGGVQASIKNELATNVKRIDQHQKLESAFQAFIQAYQETELLEEELHKEASDKVGDLRAIVWSPNAASSSFDIGIQRALEYSASETYKKLKVSNSLVNSVTVDRSAMPWLIRLANGDIDY